MKENGINYNVFAVSKVGALAGFDVSSGVPRTFLLDRAGRTVTGLSARDVGGRFEEAASVEEYSSS